MRRFTNYLVCDFLGGPRPWKFAWVINFQKAGTFVFLLSLIACYRNTSTAAWVCTAMHGNFALMVWHWLPVVVLAWVWLGLFAVNMTIKEASMSRYPEWASYKKRTWWLIPFML